MEKLILDACCGGKMFWIETIRDYYSCIYRNMPRDKTEYLIDDFEVIAYGIVEDILLERKEKEINMEM